MSDLIVRGKDSVTGQNREAGPEDRLIDSSGVPVAGVFENVNYQSVVHTDFEDNTIGGNYIAPGINYAFVAGHNNVVTLDQPPFPGALPNPYGPANGGTLPNEAVFCQGWGNTINAGHGYDNVTQLPFGQALMVQGVDNSIIHSGSWGAGYTFIQGKDISLTAPYAALVQGKNIIGGVGWVGLLQGYYLRSSGTFYNFMQGGFLYSDPNISGNQQMLQGLNNHLDSHNSFTQGANNTITNVADANLVQGYNCFSEIPHAFIQGSNNSIQHVDPLYPAGGIAGTYPQYSTFVQGDDINITAGGYAPYGGALMVQGSDIDIAPHTTFGAGYSFIQGKDIHVNGVYRSIIQGSRINPSSFVISSIINGIDPTLDFTVINSIVQGDYHIANDALWACLIQGRSNLASGTINPSQVSGWNLIQGENNDVAASYTLVQGYNNICESDCTFVQGYNNTALQGRQYPNLPDLEYNSAFVQGRDNFVATEYPTFVQGYKNTNGTSYGYYSQYRRSNWASFVQGYFNTVTQNGPLVCNQIFVQGGENIVDTSYSEPTPGPYVPGASPVWFSISGDAFLQGSYSRSYASSSFNQGSVNEVYATAIGSFAQGVYNIIEPEHSFVQGYGNNVIHTDPPYPGNIGNSGGTAPSNCTFMQGRNLSLTAGRDSAASWYGAMFMQGANLSVTHSDNWGASNTIIQGIDINAVAPYSSIFQGYNIQHTLNLDTYAIDVFAQGERLTLTDVYQVINQGKLNETIGRSLLVQGYSNYINAEIAFLQGNGNDVTPAVASGPFENIFVQGSNHLVTSSELYGYYGNTNYGGYVFAQGDNCSISAPHVLAQGQNITVGNVADTLGNARPVFAQGKNITITMYPNYGFPGGQFAQGTDISFFNTLPAESGACNFAQGHNIDLNHTYSVLAQGYNIDITTPESYRILAQGSNIDVSNFNCLAQGNNISISGAYPNNNNFGQGLVIDIEGNNCFAQGYNHVIVADRAFAQGQWTEVLRDDQKTWGSNRVGSVAQSSKIVKHTFTEDNTPVTLITLDLDEDKTYTLRGMVAARDTDTDDESASFVLTQGLAYRNIAGDAVLAGANSAGEVLFTSLSIGTDAATWDVKLVEDNGTNGNNILLQVIGSTTDQVEWCADFEFVEVLG